MYYSLYGHQPFCIYTTGIHMGHAAVHIYIYTLVVKGTGSGPWLCHSY